MSVIGRALGAVGRFLADERGSASIEFVLWVPFFAFLMVLVVDVSVLSYRYSQMFDVTRAAARAVSLEALPRDAAQVEAFIQARLTPDYRVRFSGQSELWYSIEVDAGVGTLSVFGFFSFAVDHLTARVRSGPEPLMAE